MYKVMCGVRAQPAQMDFARAYDLRANSTLGFFKQIWPSKTKEMAPIGLNGSNSIAPVAA